MSYNSSASIYVTNNSSGNATIHLSHRYSSDPTQQQTWPAVAPGGTTPTALVVGYNTGFLRTGLDWWWIGIEVTDGPNAGSYQSKGSADNPDKECFLRSEDNGKNLTFSVDTSTFLITEISGSCTTGMSKVNAAAVAGAKDAARTLAAKAATS